MARQFGIALVVHGELCKLRRHVWVTGSSHRHDDVDVVSAIVILFGAQLNSEIEHQTVKDSTVEHDKPIGARGAVMADTVGKAVD
jgi:hypothetical protein